MPIRESLDSAKAHVPSQSNQPKSGASGRSGKTNAETPDVGLMCPLDERPHRGVLFALAALLFTLICLSAAPLAGYREGWLYFQQDNMQTMYLRNLNLQPWDHYIRYGYAWHTNAVREYATERHWVLAGMRMTKYTKLWTNLKLGEASQLVGGYTAAVLAASCVIAAVYVGLVVRCVMQLSRGSSAAASRCGQPVKLKHLLRPLGSYLWPVALTLMACLAALLVAFYLLVNASNSYQTITLVPGVECPLRPDWAWWTALSAVFCWLGVLLLAAAEAWRQRSAAERAAHAMLMRQVAANPRRSLGHVPEGI